MAKLSYAALSGWYDLFPERRNNKLFLTGESYAGIYVPKLAQQILLHNDPKVRPQLAGFAVGDGCLGTESGVCGSGNGPWWDVLFLYGHHQISTELLDELVSECGMDYLKYAKPEVDPIKCREALNRMMFNWGTEQPADALAWLNQLADPDLRLSLLERNGNSYFTDHPEKSLPLALALPASQNRGQSITRLLTAWAKIDPSAALAWIGAQNDPAVAAAAPAVQGVLLGTIARDEPATALAEWASLSDPRAKKAAIQPIAEAWGQTDPAAALQWAVAQQDSPGRVHAHSELIAAWAKKDPEAALRWAEAAALEHFK
jgi:hypothetical protein